jgi:hypothetical protein
MASKIGMAMSGANGNGTHRGTEDDAKASNGDADDSKGESKAEEGDESNSNGIVKQLMSNLPTSGAVPVCSLVSSVSVLPRFVSDDLIG